MVAGEGATVFFGDVATGKFMCKQLFLLVEVCKPMKDLKAGDRIDRKKEESVRVG